MARMKLSDLKKVVEAIEANKVTEDPVVDFWIPFKDIPQGYMIDFEINYKTFLAEPTDDMVNIKGSHEIGDFCIPLKVIPK